MVFEQKKMMRIKFDLKIGSLMYIINIGLTFKEMSIPNYIYFEQDTKP